MIEPTCRFCGCTESAGCRGGCYWVLPGVCSQCAKLQMEAAGMAYAPPAKVSILLHELRTVAPDLPPQEKQDLSDALAGLAAFVAGYAGRELQALEPTGQELSQEEMDALYMEEHDGPFEETPRLWRPGDPI